MDIKEDSDIQAICQHLHRLAEAVLRQFGGDKEAAITRISEMDLTKTEKEEVRRAIECLAIA